jgi:hypothetical protein
MRMQSLKQRPRPPSAQGGKRILDFGTRSKSLFDIKLWSGSEMLDVIARHEHVRAQVIGSSTAVTINRLSES